MLFQSTSFVTTEEISSQDYEYKVFGEKGENHMFHHTLGNLEEAASHKGKQGSLHIFFQKNLIDLVVFLFNLFLLYPYIPMNI